jgi:hypothetical protein
VKSYRSRVQRSRFRGIRLKVEGFSAAAGRLSGAKFAKDLNPEKPEIANSKDQMTNKF